jgi:beta-xylosidase
VDAGFLTARNTLTQRTIGPECSATAALDAAGLQDGDVAGLAMLQRDYGSLAVKREAGRNHLVMLSVRSGAPVEVARVALARDRVLLRVECDFRERADTARFRYSVDGRIWKAIGDEHKMSYTIPHFMGHRLAIFYHSTTTPGGHADFDFFRVSDKMDGGRR